MMTLAIFKQLEMTEMFSADKLGLGQLLLALPLAAALGLFVSWIYRKTHQGFSYTASFNMTLVMVTMIVSIIMITIGSNIALSLGLIGSLSIIRFRTVLKDTVDMAYLFWAIASGLAVGSGNYMFAVCVTPMIGVIVVALSKGMYKRLGGNDYVVIVQLDPETGNETAQIVSEAFAQKQLSWQIRSSEVDRDRGLHEVVYQIDDRAGSNEAASQLIDELPTMRGIKKVSLLTSESNVFV